MYLCAYVTLGRRVTLLPSIVHFTYNNVKVKNRRSQSIRLSIRRVVEFTVLDNVTSAHLLKHSEQWRFKAQTKQSQSVVDLKQCVNSSREAGQSEEEPRQHPIHQALQPPALEIDEMNKLLLRMYVVKFLVQK